LRQGLRDLGYEDGRNLVIEYRWAERTLGRLPALAAELVGLKVNAIVTHGSAGSRAAKQATSTVPIVIAVVGDAVASGVVASLSRPGGNVTGLVLEEFESTVNWLGPAGYVDRILRGAQPASLPMEGPTKFEMIVNLNTARTPGLTISTELLERADQIIE
jgi:ABC-type uncharacterized transport system substrate-binding protein